MVAKRRAYDVAYSVRSLVGPHRLQRLAQFAHRAALLHGPNDMSFNGELIVHRTLQRLASGADSGPAVVADVGANVGEWTTRLAEAWPAGHPPLIVHAFEPSSATAAVLRRATERRWPPSVEVLVQPCALSCQQGEAQLVVAHRLGGTNSLHAEPLLQAESTEPVRTDTLDAYASRNGIGRFHLVKLDIEGHEVDALAGAAQLLSNRALDLIQFEYNWRWVASRRFLRDAFDLLSGHGYRVARITARGFLEHRAWQPELENFWEANFLAYTESASEAVGESIMV